MGGVVGKAANDVGVFIGNAFAAPFKAILGRSCENVCTGPWDLECFIEHFCIPDLAKLLMISALSFLSKSSFFFLLCFFYLLVGILLILFSLFFFSFLAVLMFFYLLLKLGICQCAVKSLCKMSCAACEAYCCTIGDIVCFLCRKLRNTKRVYRRRRRWHDIEAMTYSSSEELGLSDSYSPRNISRKRRRRRRRGGGESGKTGMESGRSYHNRSSSSRHRIKLSREVSVRIGGKSRRGRRSRRRKLELERRNSRGRRKVKALKKRRVQMSKI
ncbi:PREDICTED: uncharacterized protein LOC104813627 isoform X1 [Tarenaya hassleriana]|uniref:uncharacterized protein LOC104813627 isoform X1 n=1 Tax=Tarenaya hassleriana TaxID=28532 RepID=UPI00053C36B5|nr:PREDICTED: uncharacterized protein LOC104813627 isoform X1 [Tarenaya hassleriana]